MTQVSACPACLAAPAAQEIARTAAAPTEADLLLSLPGIHCAACIAGVERALLADPRISAARVNLTLKRATVSAAPGTTTDDLVSLLGSAGFEAHALDREALRGSDSNRAGRDLLMRLAVAGFAMMNIMLLSVAVWSGAEGATRDLFHWVSAAIALPTAAFSAQPFFASAARALRAGRMNMDVPIALAILLALGTSVWETAQSGAHAYFDAAITLTFFLLAGRYLDHRTRAIARSAAQELTALEVPRAWRLTPTGADEEVAVAALRVGDLVRVRPGGRVPVDGVVTEGRSERDRALLTGETLPVPAGPGDSISAGEVNLTGPLVLRATAVGRDSSLHRLADLVAIAESGRSRYTSLADRAARLYAPGVHILAALSFLGWYLATWDLRTATGIAAAVLIITCPCALGLAVPAVTTAASGRLYRRGLLIKDATALERLAEVDTVVFDKTGTLTDGALHPTNLDDLPTNDQRLALALAEGSSHPLARALAAALRNRGVTPATVTDLREIPGEGTEARVNDVTLRLGRAAWVGTAPGTATATWLSDGQQPPRAITFADTVRTGADAAVRGFRDAGLHVVLLSGDAATPVAQLAQRLGISDWQAEARPEAKAARISALAAEGRKVLMVGDGLNDTVALSAAHVSISPATALDAARAASDIVLLGQSLDPLPAALATARLATRRIRQNFRIASWYNVIAVPLAVAGLCSPLIAALAMSTSSITVSLNALRLKGKA